MAGLIVFLLSCVACAQGPVLPDETPLARPAAADSAEPLCFGDGRARVFVLQAVLADDDFGVHGAIPRVGGLNLRFT